MDVQPTKGDQWDVPAYLWLKESFTRIVNMDRKSLLNSSKSQTFKVKKLCNKNIKKQIKTKTK